MFIDKKTLFMQGVRVMIYTFACPVPCTRTIKVDARNDDEAVKKIIHAGAINCRNNENQSCCEKDYLRMPPLPKERLREIVKLSMKAE
jgi:hypothetical protein